VARIAVVGAGASGLAAAVELARRGHRVDVFESGPLPDDDLLDAPYTEELRRSLIHRHRRPRGDYVVVTTSGGRRVGSLGWTSTQVGGGAAVWGGLAYPPFRRDFALRSTMRKWLADKPACSLPDGVVDWPLDYDDFAPWLAEARNLLGVRSIEEELVAQGSCYEPLRHTDWDFVPALLAESGRARWQRTGPVQRVRDLWPWRHIILAARLGINIRARTKVAYIELDQRRRCARALHYYDAKGRHSSARYSVFLLACGAIQSVRTLLLSGFDRNFGPSARLVGKYMTFHLFGPRLLAPMQAMGWQPPMVRWNCLRITADNAVFPGGFVSVHSGALPSDDWRSDAADSSVKCLDIRYTGEDIPFYENGVKLAKDERDRFGMPVAEVRRGAIGGADLVHAYMAKSIQLIMDQIGLQLIRSSTFEDDWLRVGDHQMGGCRMGKSNDTSVTRPDGRFHDLMNVYAVDASSFPTALSVPPTLLTVANALRIARSV
jgi:choline dehydrogenase-like flavoprotein